MFVKKTTVCNHKAMLTIKHDWKLKGTEEFLSSRYNSKNGCCFSLPAFPEKYFYLTVKSNGPSSVHFKICSIGQYCRKDYSCYVWAEQNGEIIGGKEDVSAKINRFDFATHNSEPFVLYGEVYYEGKCPYCEEDERKEEEVKEAIEDLKRKNTVEKEELLREMNEKIMKLTVERDFLAAKLADATSELEKWKANDRKNDKFEKLENAFAQLNAKFSGLACNSSLHNQ